MSSKDPNRGQRYVILSPDVIEELIQSHIDDSDECDLDSIRLLNLQTTEDRWMYRALIESDELESQAEGEHIPRLEL